MLPIATYSTDDYYRRLVCKQLQLPEYAHLSHSRAETILCSTRRSTPISST